MNLNIPLQMHHHNNDVFSVLLYYMPNLLGGNTVIKYTFGLVLVMVVTEMVLQTNQRLVIVLVVC